MSKLENERNGNRMHSIQIFVKIMVFGIVDIIFSELTHGDDPIDSIQPIENGVIHFLDVTNKGLILGQAPNQKANDLWARISQRV